MNERPRSIAISDGDLKQFGCPYCGCDSTTPLFRGKGSTRYECNECKESFISLAHGVKTSSIHIRVSTSKKASRNDPKVFPSLEKHPRTGIPAHRLESKKTQVKK